MQNVPIVNDDSGNCTSPFLNSPETQCSHGENKRYSDRKKYFGKFVLIVFITSCVVVLFSSIITKTRHERILMLETRKILENHASQLEAENLRLGNEYSALKNDPVRIEKEARELLGYTGAEEVFYKKYNFRIKSITKKEPVKIVSQNRWKIFLFDGLFPWQFPATIILVATAYYLISYHYEYRKLRKSNC
ncbi:MAG: septum formation initiator family protein [Planctomycetia bacterium]|nr:septum formation initiator family protein [Planctomycetia bacterium]